MNFYEETAKHLDERLGVGSNYGVIRKMLTVGEKREASLYFLQGFVKDNVTERILEYCIKAPSANDCIFNLPYMEVQITSDKTEIEEAILYGESVLIVCGIESAAIIDTRQFPVRSIEEPENDRVLRGPRDGFGESLVSNTVLIRRRIHDPELTMQKFKVGEKTKCDVVICYMNGTADKELVGTVKSKIEKMKHRGSMNMVQESLAEALIHRGWYNPFPKVRYSERPDAVASMVLEGAIAILCDNTPQVMIVPTSIFDFLQESDDFYLPPLIGTYLRLTRMAIFMLALVLTPTWYLLLSYPNAIPGWLRFIMIAEPAKIPLLAQLLMAEFMIDGLKLASLNTPSMLNNSLSVVGGLILGDFAVQVGWFCPDVILYMSIVAIAAFTQQSYELGYAFKFIRILTLIATAIFGIYGYLGSMLLFIILIATNRTVGGRGYLYPLIPLDLKALALMFFRPRRK